MSRLKISIPANTIFSASIPVRITDINYGNHLGNDSLVSILHEARMMWLRSHNFSEMDAGGTGLIMKDLSVEYVNESFYGDILKITIVAGELFRMGFELFFEVAKEKDGSIVARAKTTMICYDYAARKVAMLPIALAGIMKANEAD